MARDGDIVFAGRKAAGGMVVGHDDSCCTVGDRIRKDLPGMNPGLVDQTH